MKYEVAYLSNSGNTQRLAYEIAGVLAFEGVQMTDLNCQEVSGDADVYFIGFGISGDAIPLKVMEALEAAEGKEIFLFATCGMAPSENCRASIERRVLPFLPDDCMYKGLFLCAGQFSDEIIRHVEEMLQEHPESVHATTILENQKLTDGHPNEEDFQQLREFILARLDE